MKNLTTFALAVRESPLASYLNRIADEVKPSVAHTVGGVSGLTGLALWAEMAKHLTVLMGLFVAVMAAIGGAFYACYWGVKALREWREFRKPNARRSSSPGGK